jgi:hypothetical protein
MHAVFIYSKTGTSTVIYNLFAVVLEKKYGYKHFVLETLTGRELVRDFLSIYGSTALCWTLAAFQFLDRLHIR